MPPTWHNEVVVCVWVVRVCEEREDGVYPVSASGDELIHVMHGENHVADHLVPAFRNCFWTCNTYLHSGRNGTRTRDARMCTPPLYPLSYPTIAGRTKLKEGSFQVSPSLPVYKARTGYGTISGEGLEPPLLDEKSSVLSTTLSRNEVAAEGIEPYSSTCTGWRAGRYTMPHWTYLLTTRLPFFF